MLSWFKKKLLISWAEEIQNREIARLCRENRLLKEDRKRETGCPIQFTAEKRQRLAEKGRRIDPELLKQIMVLVPKVLTLRIFKSIRPRKGS